eukprot:6653851-Ditylum_brightwellii.AAC.1
MSFMYCLIAMIYYMSLVCLPSMCDYCSTDPYMPQNRVVKELGMTGDHFLFMWCNFHVYNEEEMDMQAEQKEGEADDDDDSDDDSDDDGIFEFTMDCDAASDE